MNEWIKNLKKSKRVFVPLFFVLFIILIILTIRIYRSVVERPSDQPVKETHDYSPELVDIQAKSFYVYDIDQKKVLFTKNEHEQLALASITKLMSGLIIATNLPSTSTVIISKADIDNGEGSNGLFVGEKWDVKDLLNFSLIMSSNSGIYALSRSLNTYEGVYGSTTIDLMNAKAKVLGLSNTLFFNETGLDINTGMSGAYSSAYDVTVLLNKILASYPILISKTTEDAAAFISESNMRHIAINTNTLVNKIPGLIASKTGYTDLAGGNLVIAFDAGFMHPIIITVLGSTQDGRFTDMERLVHVTLERLSE